MSAGVIYPVNMIRLCVDGYQEELSGRAYSRLLPAPMSFSGCAGILLGMDEVFDRAGYPQAFQVRRTFRKAGKPEGSIHMPADMMEDEEIGRQSGAYGTYDVVVQCRRQSGWQGIVMDPGRTFVRRFRSEMELLYQICRVLEEEKDPEEI